MEEFLFEESLLESMEIISFEERDINEIVRENAHALLDAEMDMEELLCESGLELVEEGFVDNAKAKIKAIFTKIKELIRKFIDWIKSLFKKKEQAVSNASNKKSEISSGNSGNKSDTTSTDSDKKSDNKNEKGTNTSNSDSKKSGTTDQNVKRLGAGTINGGKTESNSNDKWKSIKVELLNIDKLGNLTNELYDKMQQAGNSLDVNASADEEFKAVKDALEQSYSKMESEIGSCWEETGVEKIITIKDGKYQYESINKKLLEVLEESQKFVDRFENNMNANISKAKDEKEANLLCNLTRVIIGLLNKHIVLLKSAYNKDMTNRQRAFIEVRRIKKESK